MRVLWVVERFPPDAGGVATAAARQAAALAPCVERLDVLRLTDALPPGAADVEVSSTLAVYRVGRAIAHDESRQILARTATNLLARHRHAVVHGFCAVHAGYVATTVARGAGVPSVVSLRGNDVDRAMFHGPRLPFLLWTLGHADALLAVSRELADRVRVLADRTQGVHLTPNGVDGSVFRPDVAPGGEAVLADLPRPIVAFAGEARFKKGLPLLLELAERLARDGGGTVALIGGVRSDERARFERWRHGAGASAARIHVVPYTTDQKRLAALYAAADLVVVPSLWDGMPNAVLEAMAAARPVVAAAVGAIPEVISHGQDGFLVAADELGRFPDAVLETLGRGPADLARVGAAARARVLRDYTVERERDALLAVYRALDA